MSSRGRGAPPNKREDYATPSACARAILRCLPKPDHDDLIVEPSSGRGFFLREIAQWAGDAPELVAVDPFDWPSLDDACLTAHARRIVSRWERVEPDHLRVPADWIIGNPPFTRFIEHVKHAMFLLAPGGVCAFLLRSSCLHPLRDGLTDTLPRPLFEIGLRQRPSFSGTSGRKKTSDSTDYSAFVWVKGHDSTLWQKGLLDWKSGEPNQELEQQFQAQVEAARRKFTT